MAQKTYLKQDSANYIIYKYIYADTIHVRGKVSFPTGAPATNVSVNIVDQNKFLERLLPFATTDSLGNYVLRYVAPQDTLVFWYMNSRYHVPVAGSRTLNVVIPEDELHVDEIMINQATLLEGKKDSVVYTVKLDTTLQVFVNYDIHEAMPYAGPREIHQKIRDELVYPMTAREAGVEGLVHVSFLISKDILFPSSFLVHRGLGYGCEEELIRVLKSTNWNVPFFPGGTATQRVHVKLLFKLED